MVAGLTLEQIRTHLNQHKFAVLKYVRVAGTLAGDQYRFAIPGFGPEHRDMIGEDEMPVSAAFCTIDYDKGTLITRGESMSLKLGSAEDDAEKIKTLLGI